MFIATCVARKAEKNNRSTHWMKARSKTYSQQFTVYDTTLPMCSFGISGLFRNVLDIRFLGWPPN